MSNLLRPAELIPNPNPNSEWPWLGFKEFAGGRVLLGMNRARLKVDGSLRGRPTNRAATYGSMLLVASGLTNMQIGQRSEIGVGARTTVGDYLTEAYSRLHVTQRNMFFPALLRRQVLAIDEPGPLSEFQPSIRTLIMAGLLARGVSRARVAAALNIKDDTVSKVFGREVALEEGKERVVAGISAGLITQQLEERTCVPLLYPNQTPEDRGASQPIIKKDQWNALVQIQDPDQFREAFVESGLARYCESDSAPAHPTLST